MVVTNVTNRACGDYIYRQGVDLVRPENINKHKEDIKQTVLRLREHVGPDGVVFSSGGIGPTHDDVTYEALASAFGALTIQSLPPVIT